MRRTEPRLQSKLLAWLLGPLLGVLVLDTAVTYWTSVDFSNRAHDRSLHEIAREVVLHVKRDGNGLKLDMSPAAERILLVDQDDRLAYKVSAPDGSIIGGNVGIASPPRPVSNGRP